MSFNGSGTFVINSTGQPVVTGTVISSSTFNSLTADLGTGLSTTVTKDGQTTTTAKIPFALGLSAAAASNFAAGTVGLPAIYLSTDTTTGLYRIGANNDGFAVSGAKVLDIASTGLGVTGTLSATGVSSFAAGTVGAPSIYLGADTTTGLYRIGANNDGFAVSGAKVLDISSTGLGVTGTLSASGAATLSGNTAINGVLSLAGQPNFLATHDSTVTNVTGDGTEYTVLYGTEVFDIAANYNPSTGIFTAPVTGKYHFAAMILVGEMVVAHNEHLIKIVTSNRNYGRYDTFPASGNPFVQYRTLHAVTASADMEVGDTAKVVISITGGAKVVDVMNGATTGFFNGGLLA